MEVFMWILCIFLTIASVTAAVFFRRREKKTLEKLDGMVEAAINGNFFEKEFDESLLSSVEANFMQYLAKSERTAAKVTEEKAKIKTLIADISHQTKTPLSNILIYTQLLGEQELPKDCEIYVKELENQTKKLEFLIVSLIKTSRLETGILKMYPKQNEVAPILEKAAAESREKAREKEIYIEVNDCEETAVFDAKWTEEAIANLVDNAVKYTSRGGKVTLRAQSYEFFCRIDVEDNGIGIGEEIQPKIFERFFRAETAAEEEGVGIGLYLVRQILTQEGGYVKVESETGKGSVFSVFLPREKT